MAKKKSSGGGDLGASAAQIAAQMMAAVQAAQREMMAKVEEAGNNARAISREERDAFKARLNELSTAYGKVVDVANEEMPEEVNAALSTLEGVVNAVNTDSWDQVNEELNKFSEASRVLDSRLETASDATLAKYETQIGSDLADYLSGSRAEIGTQESLGDTFMSRANQALTRYSSAATQTPEFIQQATRAADQLSKAALQTRMDLLSTADPRALELSAIADENAAAMMSGRISADTQANLARSGAMRALQGGFGGGGEMGRNLQARDLGLTSLDLQRQGTALYDAQRRLNYDTRVAGTQVNPFDTGAQMLQAEGNLLANTLNTAESDRNQRLAASEQRLGLLNTAFATRAGLADTRLGRELSNVDTTYQAGLGREQMALGTRLAGRDDINDRRLGMADTRFASDMGVIEARRAANLGLASDIYQTQTRGAGTIYQTQVGLEQNILGALASTAQTGGQMVARAAESGAQMQYQAADTERNIAATAAIQRQINRQASNASRNQLWGSLISTGASLLGSAVGSFGGPAGSAIGGSLGGMLGKSAYSSIGSDFGSYGQKFMP